MASSSTEKLLPLLDPIDPPLGLNAAFCNSTTTQTVVVEKNLRSWSGQDFGIKDVQSGEVVVSCEGKVGSWREKKGAWTFVSGKWVGEEGADWLVWLVVVVVV